MHPIEIVQAATDAFNQRRIEEALTFYDDAVIQRSPGSADRLELKVQHGKQALRQILEADHQADVHFHHQRYICHANSVAVESINRGEFKGVVVEQPVAVFYELKENKIVSVTAYYDRLALRNVLETT